MNQSIARCVVEINIDFGEGIAILALEVGQEDREMKGKEVDFISPTPPRIPYQQIFPKRH